MSLDSSELSRIPATLRVGALVGKSRTGAWSFPTSLFPASDWEQWDQMSQGADIVPGVGVRGACVMCVWDGGGRLNRASTVARCTAPNTTTLIPKALQAEMSGPQGTSEITLFPNAPF